MSFIRPGLPALLIKIDTRKLFLLPVYSPLMKHQEAYDAIKATVMAIHQKIGPLYHTCYLYGSLAQGMYQPGQSDVNLLVIVQDQTPLVELYEAYQPVWQQFGSVLVKAPDVVTEKAFQRHMALNPTLARHIDIYGKQVKGSKRVLHKTSALDQTRAVAHLGYQGLVYSKSLVPSMIPKEEEREEPLRQLRRVIRQLRRGMVGPEETPIELLGELHQYLASQIQEVSPNPPPAEDSGDNPVPYLTAVYEYKDQIILVVNPPDMREVLQNVDWAELATTFDQPYGGLQVTTPSQFRLAVLHEDPLDFRLRSYRHVWGDEVLADINPSNWAILRSAACFTSNIQIHDMPHAYLSAPDEATIRKVIHDYQNKLLNTTLQHELLSRLKVVEKSKPTTPLPDRTAPSHERIKGIFDHLEWWSEFYTEAMAKQ